MCFSCKCIECKWMRTQQLIKGRQEASGRKSDECVRVVKIVCVCVCVVIIMEPQRCTNQRESSHDRRDELLW